MANSSTALHSVDMEKDRNQKQPTALRKVRSRKCATKRFGIRVVLIPFGYNGTDILIPFRKARKQKAWNLIYDVPLLDESLDEAAKRLYQDCVPHQESSVYQVHTFGDALSIRTRWITIVYSTIVNLRNNHSTPEDWFQLDRRPLLTRMEDQMIHAALQALQKKVRHEPVGIYMLPPEFTLQQLQRMYELLLGHSISKQSFRQKMWESEIVIPLEETVTEGGRSQPKGLYRFNKKKYYELKRKGFFLDL